MNKPASAKASAAIERMRARDEAAELERIRAQSFRGFSLPEWFERDGNTYYCGLIARQIRTRAHTRGQTDAARNEALAIADMIESGDFDWLM